MNLNKPVNFTTKEFWAMFGMLLACTFVFQQAARDIFNNADYLHGVTELLGSAGWAVVYLQYMKNIQKKKEE